MKAKSPKPRNIKDLGRCQHSNGNGRCRMPAADRSGLCFEHARVLRDDIDHSAVLTRYSRGFQTVEGINFALGDLYVLLAQGRISPRRAAVLTYMASQMLRTLVLMRENHGKFLYRLIGAAQRPSKRDYIVDDPNQDQAPQPKQHAAADELDESHKNGPEPKPVKTIDMQANTEPGEASKNGEQREPTPQPLNTLSPGESPLPATRLDFLDAVDEAIAKANANKDAQPDSGAPTAVLEEVLNK